MMWSALTGIFVILIPIAILVILTILTIIVIGFINIAITVLSSSSQPGSQPLKELLSSFPLCLELG